MKYIQKKFNLQLFFLLTVSQTFIFSRDTTRYLHSWNFLFRKITACVNETMLVTLPLVQMNKTRRKVNQKPCTNQDKHHKRSSNVCYILNPWEHMPLNIKSNEIFLKISFGRNIFQRQLIAEAGIHGSLLWNLFWKFHKSTKRTFPEKAISPGSFSWKFTKFFEQLFS